MNTEVHSQNGQADRWEIESRRATLTRFYNFLTDPYPAKWRNRRRFLSVRSGGYLARLMDAAYMAVESSEPFPEEIGYGDIALESLSRVLRLMAEALDDAPKTSDDDWLRKRLLVNEILDALAVLDALHRSVPDSLMGYRRSRQFAKAAMEAASRDGEAT